MTIWFVLSWIFTDPTGPNGASVSFTSLTTDDIDGSITPNCDYVSGDVFAISTTIVTCTATDASGNDSTGTATPTFTPEVDDSDDDSDDESNDEDKKDDKKDKDD